MAAATLGASPARWVTRLVASIALVGAYLAGTLAASGVALTFSATPAEAGRRGRRGRRGWGGRRGWRGRGRRGRRGRGIYFGPYFGPYYSYGYSYCSYWRSQCAYSYGWRTGAWYRCLWRHGC